MARIPRRQLQLKFRSPSAEELGQAILLTGALHNPAGRTVKTWLYAAMRRLESALIVCLPGVLRGLLTTSARNSNIAMSGRVQSPPLIKEHSYYSTSFGRGEWRRG